MYRKIAHQLTHPSGFANRAIETVAAGRAPGPYQPAPPKLGRSGFAPMPRTAGQVVQGLHQLLSAARVPGPYVLVAHSMGGLFARLYAQTYPDQIRGMVLVDAFPATLPEHMGAKWGAYKPLLNQAPPGVRGQPSPGADRRGRQRRRGASRAGLRRMPLVVLSGQALPAPADPARRVRAGRPADGVGGGPGGRASRSGHGERPLHTGRAAGSGHPGDSGRTQRCTGRTRVGEPAGDVGAGDLSMPVLSCERYTEPVTRRLRRGCCRLKPRKAAYSVTAVRS